VAKGGGGLGAVGQTASYVCVVSAKKVHCKACVASSTSSQCRRCVRAATLYIGMSFGDAL
jgi:hypothetical protein